MECLELSLFVGDHSVIPNNDTDLTMFCIPTLFILNAIRTDVLELDAYMQTHDIK